MIATDIIKDAIAPQDIELGDAICVRVRDQYLFCRILKVLPNKLLTTNLAYIGKHPKVRNTLFSQVIMVIKVNQVIKINPNPISNE